MQLERRDVPALVYWDGLDGSDATVATNWVGNQLPDSDYTLVFVPGSKQDPYEETLLIPWSYGCSNLSGAYAGIQLIDDYDGTVALSGELVVEDVILLSGYISQPSSGTEITITGDARTPCSHRFPLRASYESAAEDSIATLMLTHTAKPCC